MKKSTKSNLSLIILFGILFLLIPFCSAAECSGTLATCTDYGGLGEEACITHYEQVSEEPPIYLQCAWTDPGPPGGICNPGAECTLPAGDEEYPQFSSYWDDNASLVDTGTAHFNVTVISTNGTVFLEINGTNHTASNITASAFNVSISMVNGTYAYYWGAWGNGSSHNYNVSAIRYYTVNKTEVDNEYPIFYEYWDDNSTLIDSGTAHFNVSINSTNGTVILEIEGINYTASNTTAFAFNVSIPLTSSGDYSYYWGSWGNGTFNNYNVSGIRYYSINASVPCSWIIEDSDRRINKKLSNGDYPYIKLCYGITFDRDVPFLQINFNENFL